MSTGKALAIMQILVSTVLLSWVWRGGQAAAETVRIAYPEVFPPFAEFKDGKAEGLAVDIVGAAAKRGGIEIEFVPVPFEQVQRTLEDDWLYFGNTGGLPVSLHLELAQAAELLSLSEGRIFREQARAKTEHVVEKD